MVSKCLSVCCLYAQSCTKLFCLKTHPLHTLYMYVLWHEGVSRIQMRSIWPWLQCQGQISNFILSSTERFSLTTHNLHFLHVHVYVLWNEKVLHIKWGHYNIDLHCQGQISNFILSSAELLCLQAHNHYILYVYVLGHDRV